jgi:hypothetical protein
MKQTKNETGAARPVHACGQLLLTANKVIERTAIFCCSA